MFYRLKYQDASWTGPIFECRIGGDSMADAIENFREWASNGDGGWVLTHIAVEDPERVFLKWHEVTKPPADLAGAVLDGPKAMFELGIVVCNLTREAYGVCSDTLFTVRTVGTVLDREWWASDEPQAERYRTIPVAMSPGQKNAGRCDTLWVVRKRDGKVFAAICDHARTSAMLGFMWRNGLAMPSTAGFREVVWP